MARKIGDVAIALTILLFVVTIFSVFVAKMDSSLSVDSGIVKESFQSFKQNLSGTKTDLERGFVIKTDNSSLGIVTEGSQLEERGSDSAGLLNLVSKNIIANFLKEVSNKMPGFSYIAGLLISLVAITISILLLRFFWGENKV